MTATTTPRCHACGYRLAPDDAACSRCRVARRGDVNRPMVAGYGFFLFLMLVCGIITILYLRSLGVH